MKAYEKLKFYQNICELRAKIYKITEKFVKKHYKVVGQTRDAIRSTKQNIKEGYSKDSLGEFLHSIKISRGSLEETEGDIDDYHEDQLIADTEYKELKTLFIKANYQMGRYMDSIIKLGKLGKWKQRWTYKVTKGNYRVTASNCPQSNQDVTRSNLSKGSALIITLLVITVVSAIVFSVGRLALGELKLTSQLEESDQAYYAAEAGIETGLLMFRFNHDVETTKGATAREGDLLRVDLSNPASTPSPVPTSATPPPSEKSVFDLKDWYRNEAGVEVKVESIVQPDGTVKPALAKDETVEYNVEGVSNINLDWNYENKSPTADQQAQMRFEYVITNGKNEIVDKKLYRYTDSFYERPVDINEGNKLRIKSWGDNLDLYKIAVDSNEKIDSKTINIESVGYYGGAKRKLQIKLDRTTGTILGLYDFVLLGSGGEGVKIQ